IKVAPTCISPSDLETANLTSTQVDISWTSNGDETSWEVYYGEPGFDPETEGESVEVEDSPETTLSNLSSGTFYEVYVKAICSENDESELSAPMEFVTPCEATALPFTQDFEDV